MMRTALVALLLLAATDAYAQAPMSTAIATYAAAAAADKATTLNCTLRPGCHEATPGYAWLDRKGGPALQITISTSVDVASIWAWDRLVARKHPRIGKIGLYSMAAVRGFVAVRNYKRVARSY